MAAFQFDCPQCGQSIEADDSMRGMVASCPHCEKGIVIPKKANPSPTLRPSKPEQADKPHAAGQNATVDPNFLAIQRRMAEQADEARASAERAERIRKTNRRREVITKSIYVLVAVVVCAVGFLLWKSWRDRRAAEAAMRQAAQEAERRIEEERIAKEEEAWKAQLAQRKAESDKRQQELEAKRKADTEARERRRAEEAQRRAEEERARQERVAAERAQEQLQESRRKKYDSLIASLPGLPTASWSSLKKEHRTSLLGGDYYCLVPNPEDVMSLYEVSSSAVSILSQKGELESVSREAYETAVVERGCLLVADGKAYLLSPKTDGNGQFPVPQSTARPSELSLRGVCNVINRSQVNTDNLFFDVTYLSADRKMAVPVKKVPFGQSIDRQEILDAVTQQALKSFRQTKQGAKKKRRTVVMYDGPTVRRMADGVTYVPRTPPRGAGKSYQSLRDEARRQEAAEEEARQSGEAAEREARERFCQQIAEKLDEGRIKVTVSSR